MILLQNISRQLRWKSFYFSMAFIALFSGLYSFAEFRIGDHRYAYKLEQNHFDYKAKVSYLETHEHSLRYLEIGDDQKPLIVFVHGAPSSSAFWKNLMRDSLLLSNAKLLAMDRPGYGYSGYGEPETSVKKQAASIAKIIEQKRAQHRQIILHGSSYGGTIAARIAMDFPHLVDGLLLQSASVKADAEKTYPISYPTHHWMLRWAMPGSIRTANAEKLNHAIALRKMVPHWSNITAATIVLHGLQDGLIYPDNAYFSFENLVNAKFRDIRMLADRKHDLLWTRTDLLKSSLLQLIEITR